MIRLATVGEPGDQIGNRDDVTGRIDAVAVAAECIAKAPR